MLKGKSFGNSSTKASSSKTKRGRRSSRKNAGELTTIRPVIVLKATRKRPTRIEPPISIERVYPSPYEEVPGPPLDIGLVRRNVNKMVWISVQKIAANLIEAAEGGQLATARYLFEAVGLYPATEEKNVSVSEESLPYSLLKRIAATETGSD